MGGEWEIKIENIEDAERFSRLGGYAGFAYAVVAVLYFFYSIYVNRMEIAEFSNDEKLFYIAFGFIHFIVFWLLAWRVHSGKGKYSAIAMLALFVVFKIFNVMELRFSILGVLFSGVIAYTMFAGIKGSWAIGRFQNEPNVDVFD